MARDGDAARDSGRMIGHDVARPDRRMEHDSSQAFAHGHDVLQRDGIKRAHARHGQRAALHQHVRGNGTARVLHFLLRPSGAARTQIARHRNKLRFFAAARLDLQRTAIGTDDTSIFTTFAHCTDTSKLQQPFRSAALTPRCSITAG